jgi:hypothetical protein
MHNAQHSLDWIDLAWGEGPGTKPGRYAESGKVLPLPLYYETYEDPEASLVKAAPGARGVRTLAEEVGSFGMRTVRRGSDAGG